MSSFQGPSIVLVDPLGDVLFSGESLARSPRAVSVAPPPDSSEAVTERCPETLRSQGSGVYPAAGRIALKRAG
jgi:hypothetical protein